MHLVGLPSASDEVSMVTPRFRIGALVALALSIATVGCPRASSTDSPASSSSAVASSAAPSPAEPDRVRELLRIEDTRSIADVGDGDLASADPLVRRAAVRALARAKQGATRERLLSTLADRDPDVLAWSAYGLGQICAWDRERTSRRLIARATALGIEPASPAGRLDPWFALARALGQCANPESEHTLVAWLSGPKTRSIGAVYGLGSVVTRQKRMDEETAAALLRASRGDAANDPLSEALYPFGRLKRAPVRVEEQLIEAARNRLGHNVPGRIFVLRALATLDDTAVPLLGPVLRASTGYSAAEQAEAARALGKIGTNESQRELLSAIEQLAPPNEPVALTSLVGPGFGALMTALSSVPASGKKRTRSAGLDALLALEAPPGAPAPVLRRIGLLRCAAARLTAGANHQLPALTSCDPEAGDVGSIARLAVIDRGELKGARFAAWKAYLDPKHSPVVRGAAIRMLSSHPEARGVPGLMAKALAAEQVGVVTEAATIVAAYPDRFLTEASKKDEDAKPKPEPGIAAALKAAIARKWPADAIETKGALARACGALHIDEAHAWLDSLCASPNPTLRQHAAKALSAFGPKPTCEPKPDNRYAPASELGHLLDGPRSIVLDTDVGELTIELQPDLAPVAATRIADLVAKKFYDAMAVHRVVPGFVVQFGDRGGDGFGGAGDGAEALRCETSPVSFETGVVGIALGGRDTGSSQLFVTLGPAPHLDGEYAVIGKATGPWDALTEGDQIRSARIAPSKP